MASKLEAARVEAAQEPSGSLAGTLAFQPESKLVAGALEGKARPAPASNLLENEACEVAEPYSGRRQKRARGVVYRRRRPERTVSPGPRSTLSI